MKKIYCFVLSLFLITGLYAESPKREFRSAWLTTVFNLDWPKTKVTTTGSGTQIKGQKKELTAILDLMQKTNMNAVFFQIRTECDAFYDSEYEPWSAYLSGKRGMDPGYDPTAFAIEEAHKRGIEIHAWVNPFRYESVSGKHGNEDFLRKNHPEWILDYSGSVSIIDPGNPDVRAYIVSVIKDILEKYDFDGIIFDDYFYAYDGTSKTLDKLSQDLYKPANKNLNDWRRENINKTIADVHQMIQETKPSVHFGISPFGIWTTNKTVAAAEGLTLPQGIVGSDMYEQIYCDPIAWLKEKTVDYISPQLYWPTTSSGQDYKKLCPWWSDVAKKYGRHFYSSITLANLTNPAYSQALRKNIVQHGITENEYKNGLSFIEKAAMAAAKYDAEEVGLEIDWNRNSDKMDAPGTVFYNISGLKKTNFDKYLIENKFTKPALTPVMAWKNAQAPAQPTDVHRQGTDLRWECKGKLLRFAIYAVPKELNGSETANVNSDYLLTTAWNSPFDLSPYQDLFTTHVFAVSALDSHGNESAITYLEYETEDPEDLYKPRLTLVWEKSEAKHSKESYLTTDGKQRSMVYHDGILYIANQNGKIQRVKAEDGTPAGADFETGISSWGGINGISISQNGTMLLNSGLGTTSFKIYTADPANGNATLLNGLQNTGIALNGKRADFTSISGDIEGDGGYIIYPATNAREIYILPVANSTADLNSLKTITYTGTAANALSGIAIPVDKEHFILESKDNIPILMDINGNYLEFPENQSPSKDAAGLAYFELKNKKYVVSAETLQGGINLFDMTKGIDKATKLFDTNTPDLGTAANKSGYTVPVCVEVLKNEAYIYILGTDNGLAKYKLDYDNTSSVTNETIPEISPVISIPEGIRICLSSPANVQIWTLNGKLIHQKKASATYNIPLEKGFYLVRINNHVVKIIK